MFLGVGSWRVWCLYGIALTLPKAEYLIASDLCVSAIDPGGNGLNQAWVNAVNLVSEKVYSVRTDSQGHACVSVPEGPYSVEAGRLGFLNVRYYPVQVSVAERNTVELQLPFGKIREGGIVKDATLVGTLRKDDVAVDDATICLRREGAQVALQCMVTSVLGEYALIVPPGHYWAEVRIRGSETQQFQLDLTVPGTYRNRLTASHLVNQPR